MNRFSVQVLSIFALLASFPVYAMGRAPVRNQVEIETLHKLLDRYQKGHLAIGQCYVSGTRYLEREGVLAFQLEKQGTYYNLQFRESDPRQTVDHQKDPQGNMRTFVQSVIVDSGCNSRNCPPAGKLVESQVIVYNESSGKILEFAENQARSYGNSSHAATTSVQCGAFN